MTPRLLQLLALSLLVCATPLLGTAADVACSLQATHDYQLMRTVNMQIAALQAARETQEATMLAVSDRIAALESTVSAQAETIASQGETIAAQAEIISSLSSLTGATPLVQTVLSSNTSVTEIGDLTGPTIIVAVVKALRDLTDSSAIVTTIVGLEATVANQSSQIAAFTADLAAVESLTGSSSIVTTVNSLESIVTNIADLTGSSTIMTTIESLMDSMTDLATDLASLQSLEAATAKNLTTLSQTLTSQVTLLTAADTALEKQIVALQEWNSTAIAEIASLSALNSTQSSYPSLSYVGSFTSATPASIFTTRNSWYPPPVYANLTVPSDGTYMVFAQPRVWRLSYDVNGDIFWKWRVLAGASTVLFYGYGERIFGGDNEMSGNMYIGNLTAGTVVKMQVFVMSANNGFGDNLQMNCGSDVDGGASFYALRIA